MLIFYQGLFDVAKKNLGEEESTSMFFGINYNYLLVAATMTSVISDAIIKKDKTI